MAREEEGFFDELARGLADGTLTRGRALRLMGAAVVGGALGSLGIGEAGADPPGCKRNGKHCTRNTQCCSLNCDDSVKKCAAACTSNGRLISCLDKTATPSTVNVGLPITFTITEQCPEAAGCVESSPLVDQLPPGFTVLSVDPAGTCITSGNTVTCGSRSFGPAAPFTLTIVAIPTGCGPFTNTASNGRDTAQASFIVLC